MRFGLLSCYSLGLAVIMNTAMASQRILFSCTGFPETSGIHRVEIQASANGKALLYQDGKKVRDYENPAEVNGYIALTTVEGPGKSSLSRVMRKVQVSDGTYWELGSWSTDGLGDPGDTDQPGNLFSGWSRIQCVDRLPSRLNEAAISQEKTKRVPAVLTEPSDNNTSSQANQAKH